MREKKYSLQTNGLVCSDRDLLSLWPVQLSPFPLKTDLHYLCSPKQQQDLLCRTIHICTQVTSVESLEIPQPTINIFPPNKQFLALQKPTVYSLAVLHTRVGQLSFCSEIHHVAWDRVMLEYSSLQIFAKIIFWW